MDITAIRVLVSVLDWVINISCPLKKQFKLFTEGKKEDYFIYLMCIKSIFENEKVRSFNK